MSRRRRPKSSTCGDRWSRSSGGLGDVLFTNAGVRALVRREGDASAVTRSHQVIAEQDPVGLVSIIGGKLTGYRAIAEEATQRVCRLLEVPARGTTATELLPGARPEATPADVRSPRRSGRTSPACMAAAAPRCCAWRRSDRNSRRPLMDDEPDVAAQVVHAVRHEACERVADFVFRRSRLAFTPHRGRPALAASPPSCARNWAGPISASPRNWRVAANCSSAPTATIRREQTRLPTWTDPRCFA